jgi:hypothetical protein
VITAVITRLGVGEPRSTAGEWAASSHQASGATDWCGYSQCSRCRVAPDFTKPSTGRGDAKEIDAARIKQLLSDGAAADLLDLLLLGSLPRTVGVCGTVGVEAGLHLGAGTCKYDSPDGTFRSVTGELGIGSLGVDAQAQILLSTAEKGDKLGGLSVCGSAGAGAGLGGSGTACIGLNDDFTYSGVVALYPGFGLTAGPVPVGAAVFESNTATFKIPKFLAWAAL